MVGIFIAFHFDTKIIDDQCKVDRLPLVAPQSWGKFAWIVSMCAEPFWNQFIGDQAGLRQYVHSTDDFYIHLSFVRNRVDLILLNDFRREKAELESHVFRSFHWCYKVEILDVHNVEICTWCWNSGIPQQFDCREVNRRSTDAVWIVDLVSADGESRLVRLGFLWEIINHNAAVGDIFPSILRNFVLFNEYNGVCTFDVLNAFC